MESRFVEISNKTQQRTTSQLFHHPSNQLAKRNEQLPERIQPTKPANQSTHSPTNKAAHLAAVFAALASTVALSKQTAFISAIEPTVDPTCFASKQTTLKQTFLTSIAATDCSAINPTK